MSRPQIWQHMAEKDIPLFASWVMSEEGQKYTNFEFDVLVGDPADPGPFMPPAQRYQAMYLNALKIDCVAWLFGSPLIIECKPNAGLGALGQANGYQTWYETIFGVKPAKMIICSRMSQQIQTLCLSYDIAFRIVAPANEFDVYNAINYTRPLIKELSIMPVIEQFADPFTFPFTTDQSE